MTTPPPSFFLRWNFKFDAASGNGNQTPFAVSFARLQLCQVTTRSSNDSLTKRNFRHLGTEGFTGNSRTSDFFTRPCDFLKIRLFLLFISAFSLCFYLPSPCLPPPFASSNSNSITFPPFFFSPLFSLSSFLPPNRPNSLWTTLCFQRIFYRYTPFRDLEIYEKN